MEMSLDAGEHDLTGEIDSDSDDGGAAARISGRFRKKQKKKRSTLNVEKEPNVTVNMLKTLFPNGKIKGPQAREVIGDAVLHYYQMNGQSGDINDILKSIHETAGMIRGLHKKYKKQEKDRGYAQDNIPKVFHMASKVHSDIESLHHDVGIWMARDEKEMRIPKKLLVPCRVKILHKSVSEGEWLSQHMDNLRKTLGDLERQSVEVKQVVKECVHGLQVLGDEVQTLRAEKNWALEKYQQYRKHSIALHRKNVEEMESIKETLSGIVEVEEEVDYFTKVSQRLLADNAELKALAEEDVKIVEHIPSSAGGSKASLFSAAI
jgi:chromosome segregation ATPase